MVEVETAPSGLAFARRLSPHASLLVQVAVASIPSMALLTLGLLTAAGLCFFLVFLSLLSYRLVTKDPKGMMATIIACMPLLMLLRNALSYSSVEIVLALGVLTWFAHEPADLKRVFRDHLMVLF